MDSLPITALKASKTGEKEYLAERVNRALPLFTLHL